MTISTQRNPLLSWGPRAFIEHVSEIELDEFCSEFSGYFLVVRLDDFSSQLAAGFQAARSRDAAERPKRSHHTISFWVNQEERTVTASITSSLRPPAQRPSLPASDEFSGVPDLLQSACHVLEVKKRRPEPPRSLISVGRGPDSDIVLQHPSVSKLHARFECEAEELSVSDAGSRNHTYVNGELISDKVRICAGDALKFGAVRCTICSPAGLWRAVGRR